MKYKNTVLIWFGYFSLLNVSYKCTSWIYAELLLFNTSTWRTSEIQQILAGPLALETPMVHPSLQHKILSQGWGFQHTAKPWDLAKGESSPEVYGKCFPDRSTTSTSQNNSKTNLPICCKCYPEMEGKKVRLLYYINFDRLITKIQVNQDQRHITSFIQHLDYPICCLSCPSEAGSYDRVDLMRQIYHVGIWANHYKEN